MDDASIEKLAAEELLLEAKRGAARASLNGPIGWRKCPLHKTNKRFLHNTILHSLQSNRVTRPGLNLRGEGNHEPRRFDSKQHRDWEEKSSKGVEQETIDLESESMGNESEKNVGLNSEKKARVCMLQPGLNLRRLVTFGPRRRGLKKPPVWGKDNLESECKRNESDVGLNSTEKAQVV